MNKTISVVLLLVAQLIFSRAASSNPLNTVDLKIITSLAPTGTLRVGINLGNPVLAGSSDKSAPQPKGVSIDIAQEIGRRIQLPIELISFQSASETVEALKSGTLDLIFVAIDPVRGADISYTPAYIQIEGAYMVKTQSPLKMNEEVDVVGNDIVVGKGSAYDLYLSREIKQARLIRSASSQTVVDDFMKGKGTVAAGVKQQLESDALRYQGVRILPGRFMVINQAMGTPKARPEFEQATAFLGKVISELKASGFISASMKRHGIQGAKVAE